MKISKRTLILVTGILLSSGISYWLWKQADLTQSRHVSNENNKKKNLYFCPMHPNIKSDHPGQCSVCGMDLVLAQEDEKSTSFTEQDHSDHHHGSTSENIEKDDRENIHPSSKKNSTPKNHSTVQLRLEKEQMIGVKIEKAIKRKLFKEIQAPGRIAFDPDLYTAQSEYLEAIKQWQRVKNSPLAEVKRNSQEMIRSSKIRLRILGLSSDQISAIARKGRLSEGLLVSGKDKNWVYADIFEMDLPYIGKDLSAEISANFLQGRKLPAKVISVDEVINAQTRTAKVRLQLLNNKESIRPQSYVNVKILAPLGEHLAVPIEALMDTGREIFVFVKAGKGKYEPRKVRVTLETSRYAAISHGILEGEEVVVGGNFMLDSESRLQSVIKNTQNQSPSKDSSSGHNH